MVSPPTVSRRTILAVLAVLTATEAFAPSVVRLQPSKVAFSSQRLTTRLFDAATPALLRIPADLEGVVMPFEDRSIQSDGNMLKYIDCYPDSTCVIDGVEYTIAVPCDYAVAICTLSPDDDDELVPIEVTDTEAMAELFPIAESIVAEEFGEELVLQRTPQTLTLVGELDLDDEDEDEDDEDFDDEDEDDEEEEVDVMFSFEHEGQEYQLVRLLEPMLLVGKKPEGGDNEDLRVLLTEEESTVVMPIIEDLFRDYTGDDFDDE